MSPAEFLDALDAALALGGRKGRLVLDLATPRVTLSNPVDDTTPPYVWEGRSRGFTPGGTPVYGYTRRQCLQMRSVVLVAAAADAGLSPGG